MKCPLVLVAEDELVLRTFYGKILLKMGFQPMLCANTADSYWAYCAANGAVDLVITDKDMPGHGGVWLARRIREQNSNIPIVLISGSCGEVAGSEFRSLFTCVLAKPVTAKAFREVIENLMPRSE